MASWNKDKSGNWKKSDSSSKKNYTVVNGKKVEQTSSTKTAPATSNDTWNKDTVTLEEAKQQTSDVDRGIINVDTGSTSLTSTPSTSISLADAAKQTETEKRKTAAESANSLISGTVTETTVINGDNVTTTTDTVELHNDLTAIKAGGKIKSAAQLGTVTKKSTKVVSRKNPYYVNPVNLGSMPTATGTEKSLTPEQADKMRALLNADNAPSGTGQEGTISQKPGAKEKFSASTQLINNVMSGAKYGWDSEKNPMTVDTLSSENYKAGYGLYKKGVSLAEKIREHGTKDIATGVDTVVAANKYNPLSIVPNPTLEKLAPGTKKLLTGAVVNTTAGLVQGASAVPMAAEAAVKEPKKVAKGLVFGAGVVAGSTLKGLKDDPLTTIGELAGSVAIGKVASGKPLAKPSEAPVVTKVTRGTGTATLNDLYVTKPKVVEPGMNARSLEFAEKLRNPEPAPLYSLSDMVMKKQARLTLNSDLSGKLVVEKTKLTGAPEKVIKQVKTSKPKRDLPDTASSKAMRERLKSPVSEELYSLYDMKMGKSARIELVPDRAGTGIVAKKGKIKGTADQIEGYNTRIGELRETRFNIEELTERVSQDFGAIQLGSEIGKGIKGTKSVAKKMGPGTGQGIPKVNKSGKKVKTLEDIGKPKNAGSSGGVMASKDGLLLDQVQVPRSLQKTSAELKSKVGVKSKAVQENKQKQALETRQKQKVAAKQKAASKSTLMQSINAANVFATVQVQGISAMQRQLTVPLQSTKQIQGQAQATKSRQVQKQRTAFAVKPKQSSIALTSTAQDTRQEQRQEERTLTDSIAVNRNVWKSKSKTLPPVTMPGLKKSKKSKKSADTGVKYSIENTGIRNVWDVLK